jgi:hypothetical protein
MHRNRSDAEIHDFADPIEYKDVPIRFTFELDGRREPVKIVEPQIDLPFPAGTRLLVDLAGKRVCEVVFRFDPEQRRPYRLSFSTWKMVRYDDENLHMDFGEPVNRENATQAVHRMTIVKQGHVMAWIEMSHRKARLQIRYTKGRRRPPFIDGDTVR